MSIGWGKNGDGFPIPVPAPKSFSTPMKFPVKIFRDQGGDFPQGIGRDWVSHENFSPLQFLFVRKVKISICNITWGGKNKKNGGFKERKVKVCIQGIKFFFIFIIFICTYTHRHTYIYIK